MDFNSVHLGLLGGPVLLICVSNCNLHQTTYVKLSVSHCCISGWFLIQVFFYEI